MKKLFIILFSALSLTAFAQNDVKRVAILETVDRVGDVSLGVKNLLRQSITFGINHIPGYEGYNRVDMAQINSEHNFQRSGFVSDEDIKKLGEMTGATYVLIAEVTTYDSEHILVFANLVDVESGLITNSSIPKVAGIAPDKMYEDCAEVAKSLLGKSTNRGKTGNNTNPSPTFVQSRETLIYALYSDNQYCDGKYEDKKDYFEIDLRELNRQHFRIKFVFEALSYKGARDIIPDKQYPLVLSTGWRVLGILLRSDGSIWIETNNMENAYPTGLTYTIRENKSIDLEYDNGFVTINGVKLKVEMDEYNGDDVLSSINYGNSVPFHGYISSLRVYNITE